ncbi:hypothetical protein TVAG_269000 [Trichomonas vaginalis G3]|uniref:Uncharacterized protein n=1 Tax=Trichomonas vaginalis (strain ATCC PRA-98 / G3) TaxID=412133 RepID=A2EG13_TRIV3|nr:hypothetical protein TVAGG3_0842260 [Trichomonas vaginalis G3]EAY08374.1 hypothetical protein TVAG_269000 [Trichomonas vaginalis G3]KAI5499346.1 hypothetical protein TVAGG3_0842260 [Trichomonas vaginalis G3]|eukprot:XP_001320597.1 hypothetical protein [Trichomonas vaginalis G3]
MKVNTTKKGQDQQSADNLEPEFYARILTLFTSIYDQTPFLENDFPPAKLSNNQKQEKPPAFESPITDHRLKKILENRNADSELQSNMISLKSDDLSRQFTEANTNLDEVFAPEKASRISTPKYLLLQEMDRIEADKQTRLNRHSLDIKNTEKIFTQRLKNAQKKGIAQAKARAERQQSQGKITAQGGKLYESKVKPKNIIPSDKMERAAATAKLNNRLNYMSPNDYKQFVHKKKVVVSVEDDE